MAQPTHRHDTAHRGLVPTDQLGTGTPDGTKFLCDDRTWRAVGGVASDLDAVLALSTGQDVADALTGAASPSASNAFATMADVGGGGSSGNLDGGAPTSTYGGVAALDGGSP